MNRNTHLPRLTPAAAGLAVLGLWMIVGVIGVAGLIWWGMG